MSFTIYMAECPHGRRYVGCTSKTVEARWRQQESYVRQWPGEGRAALGDAISKFGRDAFKLSVLAVVETAEDAAAVETLMIARYAAARPTGYNCMRVSHYTARRWKQDAA